MTKTYKKFDGMVPIGGVVFISNTQIWNVPLNGQVKDGWALCNGQRIDSLGLGNYDPILLTASINQALPNLNGLRFLMGSTTSGTEAGENLQSLSHYHSGTTNSTASASFTGIAGTLTVNVPAHYHSGSASAGAAGSHGHSIYWTANYAEGDTGSNGVTLGSTSAAGQAWPSYFSGAANNSITANPHSHNTDLNVGNTSGPQANSTFSASGSNTPSGSIGALTVTNKSFNTDNSLVSVNIENRPPFITSIFIMRVL